MSNKTTQRVRSPNYPNYSLGECIGFLERLYLKYGTKEVHIDDAVAQMGHSPTSSTANRVVSSMLSYGLVNSRGSKNNRYLWLSQLAQDILLAENDPNTKKMLLQKAALNDTATSSIWERYGNDIPSEATLEKVLEFEMGFSKGGADRFSSVVTETHEYARLNQLEMEQDIQSENNDEGDGPESGHPSDKLLLDKKVKSDIQLRKANLLLPGENREIVIYAPMDLTEKEFTLMGKWLELQKYGLVMNEELNDEKE